MKVNDYVSFQRYIHRGDDLRHQVVDKPGSGIVLRINKTRKTIKDSAGRTVGRFLTARIDAGPFLGTVVAIVNPGEWELVGEQTYIGGDYEETNPNISEWDRWRRSFQ